MKVVLAEFLESVAKPLAGNGAGTMEKFKATDAGPIRCRAFGPGLILEVEGSPKATIIPWANVRFAQVEMEPGDDKKAKP